MEAERIEEESIRVNQGNIAMQIDEAMKLKEKHARQAKLKEMLDQGTSFFVKNIFGKKNLIGLRTCLQSIIGFFFI